MAKSIENDDDLFPLKFKLLKIYAHRWASAKIREKIERITLYRYSSPIAQMLHQQHPVKYCVVFDIEGESLPTYEPDAHVDIILTERDSVDVSIYTFIEYYHTIYNKDSYLYLMDAGFTDVYLCKPDDNFKDEWKFLTRRLAEPNRFQGVMTKEYWILFDALDQEHAQEVEGAITLPVSETPLLSDACGAVNSDQEDKALPESETPVLSDTEKIKRHCSSAGQKGGKKSKINQPILEAVKEYMKEKQKTHKMNNHQIATKFFKKYNENAPNIVTIGETKWEIYCEGDLVFSKEYESNSKKAKNYLKSIKYNTFLNSYIPKAKKAILTDNSQ